MDQSLTRFSRLPVEVLWQPVAKALADTRREGGSIDDLTDKLVAIWSQYSWFDAETFRRHATGRSGVCLPDESAHGRPARRPDPVRQA
jgi:hypothetical protein